MSDPQTFPGATSSTHTFSRSALIADGARAGFGLLLALGPLILLDTAAVVTWTCAALAVLFAWFGGRTLVRSMSQVVLTPDGIDLLGPQPKSICWRDLEEVRLAYFAPRRAQPGQGWMQLTLRERANRKLRLDSTLEGFDELLAEVYRVAIAADLPLDPTTSSNMAALGLDGADPAAPRLSRRQAKRP